eukprot:Lithocolla_globosa_v1_NODE_446_length_4018_cov_8.851375.p2 type:complete len:133 gc:universal NODE_446_length_4018_cov_8.851375:1036-638(-)
MTVFYHHHIIYHAPYYKITTWHTREIIKTKTDPSFAITCHSKLNLCVTILGLPKHSHFAFNPNLTVTVTCGVEWYLPKQPFTVGGWCCSGGCSHITGQRGENILLQICRVGAETFCCGRKMSSISKYNKISQ